MHGLTCDTVLAARVLRDERAELMAIISECMVSRAFAWWPPPQLPTMLSTVLKSLLCLGGSGLSGLTWATALGITPLFRTLPPSYPGRQSLKPWPMTLPPLTTTQPWR